MGAEISILVVDHDPATIARVQEAMREHASLVIDCPSLEAVFDRLPQEGTAHVVVVNLDQPFEKTFDALPEIKARVAGVEVVFVSRFDDETLWIEAIQRGAYDFLVKPLDQVELKRILFLATEKHRPVILHKTLGAASTSQ